MYAPGIEKVAQAIKYTSAAEDAAHAFTTKNSYDSIGRLTKVEVKNTDANYQGDGVFRTLREISYDERLNAVVTKNFIDDSTGDFLQTRVENDWLGRGPVKEISWTGLNGTGVQRITISHYRHDGKMIKRELPNKETFLYSYDNLGRLEKITYPDGKRVAMMYDLNGNLAEAIDRRNLSTTMSYNKSDMVVNRTTLDSVRGDTVVTTTYTQFGPAKILQKENNADIVENDYWFHWSGGVLKQQQIMDTYVMQIDNAYDAAGNRITTTPTGSGASPWTRTFDIIPQFHPTTPDTDNFNRIAVADDSTGDNVITMEPDFLGLTKEIKYGDYDAPVGRMSHTYDKYLRLAGLHSNEGTRHLDITLTRDFVGNIIRRQEPALSPAPAIDYEYEYDGMDRLSSGEGETETYDELSNLVTKGANTYQYQDPDEDNSDQMRLAKFNNGTEHSYTYDSNGNPTAITNRFTSLSYDSLNALRQIVHAQTDNYWYNQDGLRVKRTENAAGTWKTTYTLYEGDNILMQEQYNNSGRLQVVFNIIVNGQILAQYKRVYPSTDSMVFFYVDYLGSRRVVMNSSGTVLDRYRYSAWGASTQDVGADDYRSFTGKDYDATGLIYFNARYYDPMTGRFLTEDPARKGGNWYAYCGNNPVVYTDATGEEPVQRQAGTIKEFVNIMNTQRSQSGLKQGVAADKFLQSCQKTTGFPPEPAVVGFFNSAVSRYIYTREGGWIDMVHFLFYAGKARALEAGGVQNPVFEAFKSGYEQESGDKIFAPWSAFSYDDLPSDFLGAYFGAEVFDPTSEKNLGEQLTDFFFILGADIPLMAPNWEELPFNDIQVRQQGKPTHTNTTSNPMFSIERINLKR